jgi:hypothetical protein
MRIQLLGIAMFLAGCSKPGPTSEVKAPPTTVAAAARPEAPAELEVPADHKLVWSASARGVQIYECAADGSGALAWKLHAPRADLFDVAGVPSGHHFGGVDKGLAPGPYWQADDGSRIHGGKAASVANPGSIPLLRLEAGEPSGTGVLSHVTSVQRLATTGGAAPAGACTAGQKAEVLYTAQYYFYQAP